MTLSFFYRGSKGSLPLALGEPPEAAAYRVVTGHQTFD